MTQTHHDRHTDADATQGGAKFTPGSYARVHRCVCKYFDPAKVDGLRYATRWTAYVQPTDACVRGEAEAVAQLFTAAPDLFAALDEILDYAGGADSALDDPYVMDRARAALALATRREPSDAGR